MNPGIANMDTLKLKDCVDAYERSLVEEALRIAKGNRSRAARLLGTSQRIVNYKIRKYRLDISQFR